MYKNACRLKDCVMNPKISGFSGLDERKGGFWKRKWVWSSSVGKKSKLFKDRKNPASYPCRLSHVAEKFDMAPRTQTPGGFSVNPDNGGQFCTHVWQGRLITYSQPSEAPVRVLQQHLRSRNPLAWVTTCSRSSVWELLLSRRPLDHVK